MTRALLPLLLLAALGSTSRAAEQCPPIERTAGPPIYAILYGYPYGAPDRPPGTQALPDLQMIDDDLLHMALLFEALGPAQMHVHGEPSPKLLGRFSAFGVRPPTWRSVRQSVAEVVADIDHDQRSEGTPRIYVYLAGHGVRVRANAGTRLAFFGRSDGAAPGYDGVMDSALLAEHVLTPLAARGDVHLIADTCFSYTLLQTRAMKLIERTVTTPPIDAYDEAFGEAFPDVGAHLAGRSVTLENRERGGLFSHALRAAAIGAADADSDGIVTYAEMSEALHRMAEDDPALQAAEVIPPGLDGDAPFIRWDQSPANRRCAMPGPAAALREGGDRFTTLPARVVPTALWLPPDGDFTLAEGSLSVVEDQPLQAPERP